MTPTYIFQKYIKPMSRSRTREVPPRHLLLRQTLRTPSPHRRSSLIGEILSQLIFSIAASICNKKGLNDLATHSIPFSSLCEIKQSRQNFTCEDYHSKVSII